MLTRLRRNGVLIGTSHVTVTACGDVPGLHSHLTSEGDTRVIDGVPNALVLITAPSTSAVVDSEITCAWLDVPTRTHVPHDAAEKRDKR
jgi:hypothetical protein